MIVGGLVLPAGLYLALWPVPAGSPGLRKAIWRLPNALRPDAVRWGHLIAVNAEGEIVANLQDPAGGYAFVTGALETDDGLFVTSLHMHALARLPAP